MDKNAVTDSNRTKQNKPLAITQKNEQKKNSSISCALKKERFFFYYFEAEKRHS